jgi:glycylpeptide N-tetradecanoyltransferase
VETPLPPGFEWANLDVENNEEMAELTDFINNHYVEGPECDFRLNFDQKYIYWNLTRPGNKKEYQMKVINSKTKKILAFIMCCEIKLNLFEQ